MGTLEGDAVVGTRGATVVGTRGATVTEGDTVVGTRGATVVGTRGATAILKRQNSLFENIQQTQNGKVCVF